MRYRVLATRHEQVGNPNPRQEVLLETNSSLLAHVHAFLQGLRGCWADCHEPWVHDTEKK